MGELLKQKKMSGAEYIKNLTAQNAIKSEKNIKNLRVMLKEEQKEKGIVLKEPLNKKKDSSLKKKLCIIGTAGSRHKAPWDDPNAEFWGVAHCLLLNDIPKLDKVFEIHLPYVYDSEISPFSKKPIIFHANKEDASPWREKKDITVVTATKDTSLNKVEVFERDRLVNEYRDLLPVSDAFYVTNSIAWMLVMALDKVIKEKAYDEIHLYGIHLETTTEWQYERPCNELWLGIIMGWFLAQGIKGVVHMPEESDVLRGYHEYGYADIEVRRKKIQSKVDTCSKEINVMTNRRNELIAVMQKLKKELSIPFEQKLETVKKQIEALNNEIKKYETCKDKEQFKRDVIMQINTQLTNINGDILKLDSRINAFRGAQETHQYYLKELNA